MFENLVRVTGALRSGLMALPNASSATLDLAKVGIGEGSVSSYFARSAIIVIVDARFEREIAGKVEAVTDLLLVRAAASTDLEYEPRGNSSWLFRIPEITVSAIARGTSLDVKIGAGRHQRALAVLIDPRAMFEQHGVLADELPAPLRNLAEGACDAGETGATLPMQPEIASLVDDLRHSSLTGPLREMQVEGRAAELLALVASTWKARLTSAQTHGLRGRDAGLLANARRILLDRCTQPPKLQELASELGTNRTKINQLFRNCIGVTPQEYTLHRRIERAQSMIFEGKLNVGQIADAVGYQHQSSFTTAFRAVTGMSPREFAAQVRERASNAQPVMY
jgi:AraC-like DNA-binding protein